MAERSASNRSRTTPSRPLALILAGGESRRMGGGTKPLIDLAGRPLIAWILESLAPQCRDVVINARGEPHSWAAWGRSVVPDCVEERGGPLAGILSGLKYLEERADGDVLLTVPGDTPFLPADLVARLNHAWQGDTAAAVCAISGGKIHPVVALWPVAMRPALEDAFGRGVRSVMGFMAAGKMATAAWPTEPYDPFLNVNTPQDLATAERIAAFMSSES